MWQFWCLVCVRCLIHVKQFGCHVNHILQFGVHSKWPEKVVLSRFYQICFTNVSNHRVVWSVFWKHPCQVMQMSMILHAVVLLIILLFLVALHELKMMCALRNMPLKKSTLFFSHDNWPFSHNKCKWTNFVLPPAVDVACIPKRFLPQGVASQMNY